MKKCHFCYFDNPDAAMQCTHCGADLPSNAPAAKQAAATEPTKRINWKTIGFLIAAIFAAVAYWTIKNVG